jgi:hypothetical protein
MSGSRSPFIWIIRQQLRQLGDVRRNPSRLVFGEQLGRRAPPRFILEIDIGKLLAIVVALPDDG